MFFGTQNAPETRFEPKKTEKNNQKKAKAK